MDLRAPLLSPPCRCHLGDLLVLAFALAPIAGCEASGGERGDVVVSEQDSSGVRIVTLGDVYDLRLPEWGLEERLTIGESTGAPEYELFRVTDATVLQDGSIAVANRGTAEVRVYGPDGRYVRSFGREGQGPGEFERLSWVARADGDVLVTFDADLRRVTWFASTGEVLRTLTIEPEAATPANATRFGTTSVEAVGSARGRLLVRAGYLRRSGEGEFRDMFTLALADERGALADTLGQYSGQELYFHAAPSGLTLATPPIFGHDTHIGAAADRLVAGSTERFALDVYDGSVLQMKIVATVDVAPATQTEVEAWLQSRRERASEGSGPGGELARLSIEAAPVRQTPPAFQRLAVDSERSIWVEEPYRVPHGTSRWVVLSADGTPSARVELPMSGPTTPRTAPDLTILEIGEGYILGLRRDEHEIEQVVLYRLERRP